MNPENLKTASIHGGDFIGTGRLKSGVILNGKKEIG
jgi:hypothetical protein